MKIMCLRLRGTKTRGEGPFREREKAAMKITMMQRCMVCSWIDGKTSIYGSGHGRTIGR